MAELNLRQGVDGDLAVARRPHLSKQTRRPS